LPASQSINYAIVISPTLETHLLGKAKIIKQQREQRRTMKLLLDEMYAGLKEYFETLGYQVQTAQEVGLKSAKDRNIVEYAGKHGLILVTQDQKPAELAELLGVKCVFISNLMIAKLVDQKIRETYQ